jgi:hypothetical protein
MAVSEEIQRQVLEEAYSATPNYSVDPNDPRFAKVESDKNQDLADLKQVYYGDNGIINSSDQFFQDQSAALQNQANEQARIQNEQLGFTIEKIEQQKEQAQKDYLKEQSASYVDWQKQSNQYGTEAEKMASSGLLGTGYSESSQVSMYNTYQNRVATAREVLAQAKLNYDNNIKEAMLQNSAALAEIYSNLYVEQARLALEGFQYKNQLVLDYVNKEIELKNQHYNRYQDVLQQINTENAMAEDIRQFNESMAEDIRQYNETQAWNTKQAELDRQFQAELTKLDQKFKADQNALDRKHDKEMLDAQTKAEKERIEAQYKKEKALLEQELANEKAVLKYKNDLAKQQIGTVSGGSGGSSGGGGKTLSKYVGTTPKTTTSAYQKLTTTKSSGFTGSTYKEAVSYMKSKGVPSSNASGAMTESEWSRRKTSYAMYGTGGTEVKNYSSYDAYLKDYVKYCVETYGK